MTAKTKSIGRKTLLRVTSVCCVCLLAERRWEKCRGEHGPFKTVIGLVRTRRVTVGFTSVRRHRFWRGGSDNDGGCGGVVRRGPAQSSRRGDPSFLASVRETERDQTMINNGPDEEGRSRPSRLCGYFAFAATTATTNRPGKSKVGNRSLGQ